MKKWFGNLKIGVKITCGFLVVAMIAGIVGIIGTVSLMTVGRTYSSSYVETTSALEYTEKISTSFQEIRANLFEMSLAENRTDKDGCVESINEHRTVIDNNLSKYKAMLEQYSAEEMAEDIELVAKLEASVNAFGNKRMEFMNGIGMDTARRSEAFRILSDGGEMHALAQDLEETIEALMDLNNSNMEEQIAKMNKMSGRFEFIMILFAVIGVILAVVIGRVIARNISKRIGVIVEVTDNLSKGDLDVSIDVDSKDEIGVLAASYRNMSDNLKAVIGDLTLCLDAFADGNFELDTQAERSYVGNYRPMLESIRKMRDRLSATLLNINTAAEQVALGSEQVSDGAQALASGSTEQASSVEELAASVEKISEQAQENSLMVTDASKAVQESLEGVKKGNMHMEHLTHSMEEIESASNQIANITKVIEDIAFQTNILALNAAIEAARAGSAGKGFAVVADEVRALAAKSSEAASQTAELIENSVATVSNGTDIMMKTAEILKEVGFRSYQVTESFGNIERSIEEQERSIEQIKEALSQISSVVQTNAATAEENSATSEEMSAQASTLRQEVGRFRLWRA